jgi:hypothetical protein
MGFNSAFKGLKKSSLKLRDVASTWEAYAFISLQFYWYKTGAENKY